MHNQIGGGINSHFHRKPKKKHVVPTREHRTRCNHWQLTLSHESVYNRVGILLFSGQEGIGWWVLCLDLVLGVVAYEALYRICPVDTGGVGGECGAHEGA